MQNKKLIELFAAYPDNNVDEDIVSEWDDYSSTFTWRQAEAEAKAERIK